VPRSMPCGHTFCDSCLAEISRRTPRDVKCPTCRTSHSKPVSGGFPANFALLDTVEKKRSRSSHADSCCGECQKPAILFCSSCGDLCGVCSSSIHNRRYAKSHVVCAIEDKPGVCSEHDEPIKLFCEQCQSVACALCPVAGAHKGHDMVPLAKAIEPLKKSMQERLETLKAYKEVTAEHLGEINLHIESFESKKQEATISVRASVQKIIEALHLRELTMLKNLQAIATARRSKTRSAITSCTKTQSELTIFIQEGDNLQDMPATSFLEKCGPWLKKVQDVEKPEQPDFQLEPLVPQVEVKELLVDIEQWGNEDGTKKFADVKDRSGNWYVARIVEEKAGKVLIRFEGYSVTDWLAKASGRIATLLTHTGSV